jgi:hypothetical protein
MKTFLASLTLVTVSFLSAQVDARSNGVRGIGPRIGVASDPDQFRFGGHLDLGDIAPNLVIMPNVEFGIGDDVTTIAPTFELDYRFRSGWSEWAPYVGGGIGPVIYSTNHDGSSVDLALYMQFGIGKGSFSSQSGRFFMEGKFGLVEAPTFVATVGWVFGQ